MFSQNMDKVAAWQSILLEKATQAKQVSCRSDGDDATEWDLEGPPGLRSAQTNFLFILNQNVFVGLVELLRSLRNRNVTK